MSFGDDHNRDSLTPRPADEYLNLPLSAEEITQAVFGVEREPLEIAEAVETETSDLAFEADLFFAGLVAFTVRLGWFGVRFWFSPA